MVTSFYAAILGILYARISLATIRARRSNRISLGAGENNEILYLVSAHNNFASYIPMLLILLYLAETKGFYAPVLIVIATVFTVGRVLHFLSFRNQEKTFKKRRLGMQMTIFPMVALSLINLFLAISSQL